MSSKCVLITGITGQDGSYLAQLLLQKGYEVHGLHRHISSGSYGHVEAIKERIRWHRGDLLDPFSLERVISEVSPDELYHMADQDNVDWSFSLPGYTLQVTTQAVISIMEAVSRLTKRVRVLQPISALIFGDAAGPQTETTPMNPQSPYACAKLATYHITRYYREVKGIWVSNVILGNHVSLRRSEVYLLPRLCRQVVRLASQRVAGRIEVGNLEQMVDIGYAPDYVEWMWRVLQLSAATDVVMGSGSAWTIRGILAELFYRVGLIKMADYGAIDPYVQVREYHRPGLPSNLWLPSHKLRELTGWAPPHSLTDIMEILMTDEEDKLDWYRPAKSWLED